MDLGTAALFAIVALLGINQVVLRVPALLRSRAVFFGLLVLEIAMGSAILVLGLPGFEGVPGVTWAVGLLFFLHVAQNLGYRGRRLRALAEADAGARRERAAAIAQRVVDPSDDDGR